MFGAVARTWPQESLVSREPEENAEGLAETWEDGCWNLTARCVAQFIRIGGGRPHNPASYCGHWQVLLGYAIRGSSAGVALPTRYQDGFEQWMSSRTCPTRGEITHVDTENSSIGSSSG